MAIKTIRRLRRSDTLIPDPIGEANERLKKSGKTGQIIVNLTREADQITATAIYQDRDMRKLVPPSK